MRIIELNEPRIVYPGDPLINSSGEIANYKFVMNTPTKSWPTGNVPNDGWHHVLSACSLLTFPPGMSGIRIVDCHFVGPERSPLNIPHFPPGSATRMHGLEMFWCNGMSIEGCTFERFPRAATYFQGCRGVKIHDLFVRNADNAIKPDYYGPRNRYFDIRNVHFENGWALTDIDKHPDYASIWNPDRGIGSNGISGYLADSIISNLTIGGEVKAALKLVNPVRVEVWDSDLGPLMNQGSMYWNNGAYNSSDFDESLGGHAKDVSYHNCMIRPGSTAWMATDKRNPVQISYDFDRLKFNKCTIWRSKEESRPGVQLWEGVDADFRECTFIGWNGPDDVVETGDYGSENSVPADINDDFGEVNNFIINYGV